MESALRKLFGMSSRQERERALRWFARLAEGERAVICDDALQRLPAMFMADPTGNSHSIAAYAALLLAVRRAGYDTMRRRGYRIAGKKELEGFARVRLSRVKNLQLGRAAPVRENIERHWAEVVELKQQGVGFRAIARYLHTQRRVGHVSEAYLRKLWKERNCGDQLHNVPTCN